MSQQHRSLPAVIGRSALVFFLIWTLGASAFATANAVPVVTAIRATTNGTATRITIAGTAPMAYAVRRDDPRTLIVELPNADVSRLASAYPFSSPLVAGVRVERAASPGASLARLRVGLRAPARDRSEISANGLVVELWPDNTRRSATDNARSATAAASQPVAAASLPQATPTPAPTPSGVSITPGGPDQMQQPAQGRQYGQQGFVGEPININVVNADIRDILNYITEQYGVNFVIDRSVTAVPVTVNVTDVPWNIALDAILRANRLGIEVTGNILRVATIDVLATETAAQQVIRNAQLDNSPLVTEFIRLNYARAGGALGGGGYSGGRSAGEAGGGSPGGGDSGILPIIQRRLSRRGGVEIDGRSNTLIVTDVPENIAAIRQLIALLDQPEPQVEIETRIVIANRNFSRDLGVQLAAVALNTGRGAGGSFSTLPRPDANQTGLNPGGVPGGVGQQPTSALGANLASTVIGLTTGIIGTAQISALITAAENRGQAKVVASPRVTALNNRTAEIESGQQIPVVTPQSGGGGGALVFTTSFVSVPLRLSVTPQITDVGTVVLRVTAENNSINTAIAVAGTPGIDTQRMQTEVLVPDGGTTVIGGVLADNESELQNRTPGLSSIPVLGNLFRRRLTTRQTNEILFFITPRIYRPDYQGRPTSGTVGTGTRTVTVPQPVPLGNPPTNTPSAAPQQQLPQQLPQVVPQAPQTEAPATTTTAPATRP